MLVRNEFRESQRRLTVTLLLISVLVAITLVSNERSTQPLVDINSPDLSNISGCSNLSWCTLARQAIEEQRIYPTPPPNHNIPVDIQKQVDEITKIQSQPDFDINLTLSDSNITGLLDFLENLVKTHVNDSTVADHNDEMPEYIKKLLMDMRNLLIGNLKSGNSGKYPILSSRVQSQNLDSKDIRKIDELLNIISSTRSAKIRNIPPGKATSSSKS